MEFKTHLNNYWILNLFDLLTTKIGLSKGMTDLNPLVNSSNYVLLKMSMLIFSTLCFYLVSKTNKAKYGNYTLIILNIILFLGVLNNIYGI